MLEDISKYLKHLGLIIDGNGRWAKSKGLPRSLGHKKGFDRLEQILKICFYTYNIPVVSVFAFSSENWNRPKAEVDFLMNLFRKFLKKDFVKKYPDVRCNFCGDLEGLPKDICENVKELMEITKEGKKYTFNIMVNYGGQDEIVNAVNQIVKSGVTTVTKATIEENLYTCGQVPVDFVIRTSGEQRISNFMLWQMAYAELYFTKTNWPAFTKKHLEKALLEFKQRDRRFGAIEK